MNISLSKEEKLRMPESVGSCCYRTRRIFSCFRTSKSQRDEVNDEEAVKPLSGCTEDHMKSYLRVKIKCGLFGSWKKYYVSIEDDVLVCKFSKNDNNPCRLNLSEYKVQLTGNRNLVLISPLEVLHLKTKGLDTCLQLASEINASKNNIRKNKQEQKLEQIANQKTGYHHLIIKDTIFVDGEEETEEIAKIEKDHNSKSSTCVMVNKNCKTPNQGGGFIRSEDSAKNVQNLHLKLSPQNEGVVSRRFSSEDLGEMNTNAMEFYDTEIISDNVSEVKYSSGKRKIETTKENPRVVDTRSSSRSNLNLSQHQEGETRMDEKYKEDREKCIKVLADIKNFLVRQNSDENPESNQILHQADGTTFSRLCLDINGETLEPFMLMHDMEGVTAEEVTQWFWDPMSHLDWDLSVTSVDILKKLGNDDAVLFQLHKRYWPFSARCSCFRSIRTQHIDDSDVTKAICSDLNEQSDLVPFGNIWSVINLSVKDESASVNPDYVMATISVQLLAQTLVAKSSLSNKGENDKLLADLDRKDIKCRIRYFCHINPGGYIPAVTINVFAQKDFPKFISSIHQYVLGKVKK